MLDVSGFTQKIRIALSKVQAIAVSVLPDSLATDRKFVRAVGLTCALHSTANKKVTSAEVEATINLISSITQIKDLGLTHVALNVYSTHIQELHALSSTADAPFYTIKVSAMLEEISHLTASTKNAEMLTALLPHLSNRDVPERTITNRIKGVLC